MSDAFEDRLRSHLAGKAAEVQADPDLGALMERSVGRSGQRRLLAVGAAAIAVVFAGSGVLTGVSLAGGGTTATPLAASPSTSVPGRAGASLAPGPSGGSDLPSIAVQTPYTFLFTRTTSSGVTIRAYGSGDSTAGGCTQTEPCPPVGIVPGPTPCPKGAMCAQPMVSPPAGGTSTGGVASSGPAVGTPETLPTQPSGSGSTGSGSSGPSGSGSGSGSTGTVPSQPTGGCGQLVLELSTDRAVGSGSVLRPTAAAPSPDTVELLGAGSFGTPEGAPVGWVAVWVGSGVASVQLTSGGTTVDTMAPDAGIVVLAAPRNAELAGATVVGVDQGGTAVATVPADQVPGPDVSNACTPTTPTTPTTTSTTTPPAPTTTTTTSAPTAPKTTLPIVPTTAPTTAPPTPTNAPVTSQRRR